jgi:hypothetical protein
MSVVLTQNREEEWDKYAISIRAKLLRGEWMMAGAERIAKKIA